MQQIPNPPWTTEFQGFANYTQEVPRFLMGLTHAEMEGMIAIPLDQERYVEWIQNPEQINAYSPVQTADGWVLIKIEEHPVLDDVELEPLTSPDTVMDVMLVLDTKGKAYVHIYNQQLAENPNFKAYFYGVEADDALAAVFDIEASGLDTEKDVEFDPDNIQVWIKAPMDTISYGLRIV
jgi:hypothetical protein